MSKNYSRLARIEEKREKKSAITFGVLSVVILIAFVFLGIPALVKITGFVSDLRSSGKAIEKNDTMAPPNPQFDSLPDYTNKQSLDVGGTTEAGAVVTISLNGNTQEVISDSSGRFNAKLALKKGENEITAFAKDPGGNKSGDSKLLKIILDTESPDLSIDNPQEGTSFSGSKQKEITVTGKTDAGSQVEVNGQIASVDNDGKYTKIIGLSSGENEISVKSTDQAGNSTEKSISITYQE